MKTYPPENDLRMARALLAPVGLVVFLSACSLESPDPQAANTVSDRERALMLVQSQRPEITVEKILTDVVGKNVTVPDVASESQPMDWVFEASEPKNAEILERKANDKSISLVVQMNTGGAPGSDDANVQLSGKLMLLYEWNGQDWILRRIQNMTFRYTRRLMI